MDEWVPNELGRQTEVLILTEKLTTNGEADWSPEILELELKKQ